MHIDESAVETEICLPLSSYTGESVFFLSLLLAFFSLYLAMKNMDFVCFFILVLALALSGNSFITRCTFRMYY